MNNHDTFEAAMDDFRISGGAMNFIGQSVESGLWQVGTVEEIEEATGTPWRECVEYALRMHLRSVRMATPGAEFDKDEIEEAVEYLCTGVLPASTTDTRDIAWGLGVDQNEAWGRWLDVEWTPAMIALANIYRDGPSSDYPDHLVDRWFASWMREHAATLPQDQNHARCSLCGGPSGIEGCGADWYLCARCEGTPEAEAAGYVHR